MREARLQQMRDRQANKPSEVRQTRLQQMSIRQRQRLTLETAEEREVQLQHASEGLEREICTSGEQTSQLFTQPSVQEEMRRFHAHINIILT